MDTKDKIFEENLELQMLLNIKEDGFNYKSRREPDWRENYELDRDKVTINRLTQRQTVNLPLMKTTRKTIMKDISDMPVIVLQNLDNDKQAEILANEAWKKTLEDNNAEIQDVVDKKQDFFYGRTFDSWQVEDGKVIFDIEDPEDLLVPRFINPYNLDSGRSLTHINIFVPLSSLKRDPDLDQEEVKKLEKYFESELGIVKAQDNQNALQQKNQKLADMGVPDTEDPVLGETYVQLTVYYVYRDAGETWKDHKDGKTYKVDEEQIFVYTEAEEATILMKKPQEKIIGVTSDHFWRNHYRFNSWGDDVDNQDFWTDGIADIIRPLNKILNAWFSQIVENRTLRNFGMHYYDSSLKADGFVPSTFNPQPWGWYPVPGKPSEVLQKVDIPDLSESLDEVQFVTEMANNASGATASKQGATTPGDKTKFEINAVLKEATQRTQGMSKFYTKVWEQRATKFLKLVEAAHDRIDSMTIYKEGKNTDNIYKREVAPKDWMTTAGYRVKVWSQDEKKSSDTDALNKDMQLLQLFPGNPKLMEVVQRKGLEIADLKPEEVNAIMEFEKQKQALLLAGAAPGLPPAVQPGAAAQAPQPMQPIQ
jgi:hypothetical protein